MNNRPKFNVIDLFAGCGGLTDGFEQTELYHTVGCVEWDTAPHSTLVNRLKTKWSYEDADRRVLRFDIQRTNEVIRGWSDDPDYGSGVGLEKLAREAGGVDLVIGGPPCQAYSLAGRVQDKDGMRFDYRNFLFESYVKIVDYFRPKAFIFENVPGMLSAAPGGEPIIDLIQAGFEKIGYQLVNDFRDDALIDLSAYGVPQKRTRVIILGLDQRRFGGSTQRLLTKFYEDILPAHKVTRITTVRDAINDLPVLRPNNKDYRLDGRMYSHQLPITNIPNHVPRYHNRRDMDIFFDLAIDIKSGDNYYNTTEKIKNLYTERTGKSSNIHKYYVLRWDEPSNTIPAHLHKDGLRHIHPDPQQARSITVREAARLQTFDDDFEFLGSMGTQFKMVGNAVPPLFARHVAESLYPILQETSP